MRELPGEISFEILNFRVLGLEHTGQLGDLIVGGGYLKSLREDTIDVNGIKYSNRVSCEDINVSGYEGHELMSLYLRGFQGALSTHYIRSNYTYAVSPFIDPEFIDICFSIPKCLRIYNRLYWTWINKNIRWRVKFNLLVSKGLVFYFSEIDAACSRGISQRLAHNWKSPF